MDYDYELYYDDSSEDQDSYYYGAREDDLSSSPKVTISQLYQTCLKPVLYDSMKSIFYVLLICLVYRLLTHFIQKDSSIQHIISILTGLFILTFMFSTSIQYIIFLVFLSYTLLFLITHFQYIKYRSIFLTMSTLLYVCICELWLVESKQWHKIRGTQMIILMKCTSLAFDLDIGRVKRIPNIIYYTGYLLCPSSCIFGPWISYNEYYLHHSEKLTLKNLEKIIIKFLLACTFLMVSTCWSGYIFSNTNWKWIAAYRDALSFRTSHYFVSYISEITLLLCGYSNLSFNGVTNPFSVEFPRSIVHVVIYWNIPMHNWLKVYIFNTSRNFGNFVAILSTYAVSSLLHGISFQLSAVLLSLGLYSYVEVMLRKKLAAAFSACVLAKSCKTDCWHKYKKFHPLVLLVNGCYVFLTIFHLAYLGVVFDSSQEEESGYSWQHSLKKWATLDYLSHYIVFLMYVMYFAIK